MNHPCIVINARQKLIGVIQEYVCEYVCLRRTLELYFGNGKGRARRFVLAPLADLAPDLRDPVTRKTVRELLGEVRGQAVRRYMG